MNLEIVLGSKPSLCVNNKKFHITKMSPIRLTMDKRHFYVYLFIKYWSSMSWLQNINEVK